MVHRNRTSIKVLPCEYSRNYCCLDCKVKDCCLCHFDGKKDILNEVLEQNKHVPFTLDSEMMRGFGLLYAWEAYYLRLQYLSVLRRLGYRGSSKEEYRYSFVKGWTYMPPGGFLMWHTNKYDNAFVPYRIYLISVDRPGESAFKYQLHNGEIREVFDFHGAVRIFKNSHTNSETGDRSFLWHTIYSKSAHRQSIGFEIRPRELVALLDSCETCWELLRSHKSGNVSDSQK